MEIEQIEPGVARMKAPKDPRGFENGDIYLYNLNDMSDEAIVKYKLTSVYERYKAGKVDD